MFATIFIMIHDCWVPSDSHDLAYSAQTQIVHDLNDLSEDIFPCKTRHLSRQVVFEGSSPIHPHIYSNGCAPVDIVWQCLCCLLPFSCRSVLMICHFLAGRMTSKQWGDLVFWRKQPIDLWRSTWFNEWRLFRHICLSILYDAWSPALTVQSLVVWFHRCCLMDRRASKTCDTLKNLLSLSVCCLHMFALRSGF